MQYLSKTKMGKFIPLLKRIKLVTHVTKNFFIIIIGARPKTKIKEGMPMRNIIPDFTKSEIEFLLENCNFTKDEKTLFMLRNEEHSLEECAELMNVSVSTIYRINSKLNKKIARVI